MKRILLTPLTKIIALAISIITVSTTYTTNVYLQNSYGATLKYIVADPSTSPTEYTLAINTRSISLGDVNTLSDLLIRTTGVGSGYGLSPYYSLNNYITQIKQEKNQHLNSDAIIDISSSYGQWYITLHWEDSSNELSMTMNPEYARDLDEIKLMSLQTATERLKAIKEEILGKDYANKVNAICSADYRKATTQGFIDLCARLLKDLMAPKFKNDPRFKGPKLNFQPAIDEIKESIDRLFRTLNNYRIKRIVS